MAGASRPYILSYRDEDRGEAERLDTQHRVITNAILDGRLIHPSIPDPTPECRIADIGCGTGIWLEEVSRRYFPEHDLPSPTKGTARLIGFDANAHNFNPSPVPAVSLVEHDCSLDFEAHYHDAFDIVNMRGLAFAMSSSHFARLVRNVIRILKPGGFLQWLENDSRLFKAFPASAKIEEALQIVGQEQRIRGFIPRSGEFMIEQVLSQDNRSSSGDIQTQALSIVSYKLLPGGFARGMGDPTLNCNFSDVVLKSLALVLKSCLLGLQSISKVPSTDTTEKSRDAKAAQIEALMVFIERIRESGEVRMGGLFPQIVVQKTAAP